MTATATTPVTVTPVTVVKGCLSCPHYGVNWDVSGWPPFCSKYYRIPGTIRTYLPLSQQALKQYGDTPPDWCPLPKLGETVMVRE